MNHKWLEITPPKGTHFYVSKEFVGQAGGPEHLANMEKRKSQVEELLTSAYLNAEAECKKAYEEMAPQQAIEQFQTFCAISPISLKQCSSQRGPRSLKRDLSQQKDRLPRIESRALFDGQTRAHRQTQSGKLGVIRRGTSQSSIPSFGASDRPRKKTISGFGTLLKSLSI